MSLLLVDQFTDAATKTLTVAAGNIASGKTLLLRDLSDTGAFVTIPEPVEVWQTGTADELVADVIRGICGISRRNKSGV